MLRVAARSSRRLRPTPVVAQRFVKTTTPLNAKADDTFSEREKSMEDKAIRDHEKRLLDDMAAQLARRQTAGQGGEVEQARNDLEDRLLETRKELLGEIREIQDSVAELNFRVKRLESRVK